MPTTTFKAETYNPRRDMLEEVTVATVNIPTINIPKDTIQDYKIMPVQPATLYGHVTFVDRDIWLQMCHDLMELIKRHIDQDDLDISDEEFLRIIQE